MRPLTLKSAALCILILSLAVLSGAAQTAKTRTADKPPIIRPRPEPEVKAPAGSMSSIAVIRVKPDRVNQWIELQKNEVIPALKKAGVKERSIFQTAQFGEAFEYVVITPIASLAQFDGEPPLRKALGEEGFRAYQEKARQLVNGVHTFADQERPDLSHIGNMTGMNIAVVATVQVFPGRTADFETLIKTDVLPAVKKGGATAYFVSQTIFGGDISQYTTVTTYNSFADMAKGSPLVKGMGQAGYERFLRKTTGIVKHVERSIYRFVPDLSFSGGS